MTLQVWDELWLFLYLGSGLTCWAVGPATAVLGLSRLWSLGVALLVTVVPPTVHRLITTRLGPPRLRALGREHAARTWSRQRLSWLYRLVTSDWPRKN